MQIKVYKDNEKLLSKSLNDILVDEEFLGQLISNVEKYGEPAILCSNFKNTLKTSSMHRVAR